MKELVVISGKGGTGKTSIVAAFAALANNAVLADCDVDAADLHLVLNPTVKQTTDFSGGKQASVIAEKCIGCRKCQDLCRFDAIKLDGPANDLIAKTYRVDPISCEGCKVCVEFCPADAIEFNDQINGQWFMSETRFGTMVHAELGIAEENSGKLVFLIRKETKRIAEEQEKDLISSCCGKPNLAIRSLKKQDSMAKKLDSRLRGNDKMLFPQQELIIIDGSPGIGCPVIASITGADLVLIVTEPTLSGKHDLERVAELAAGFGMPVLVAINKYDLNPEMAAQIEKDAGKRGIKVVGEIRYDKAVTKAQIAKQSIVEYTDTGVSEDIKTLWANVVETLN